MRAVKGVDTGPELVVRRLLHGMGYRFRLHRQDLPGKPDLTFSGRRKVIFVHGCFWHGHDCARGSRVPKTNRDYWLTKIGRNRARDHTHMGTLKRDGWSAFVIWECELKDRGEALQKLAAFLGPPGSRDT